MKTSEAEKKKYLRQYIPCVVAVKEAEQAIQCLNLEIKELLKHIDFKLLETYFSQLRQARSLLIQTRYKKWFTYTDIYRKIERIEDETEKRILCLRYLRGYSWERVEDIMGYSIRQIHNLHKRALEHFKL